MSGGSLKKLGTESNGISGTDGCCANSVGVTTTTSARAHFFKGRLTFALPRQMIEGGKYSAGGCDREKRVDYGFCATSSGCRVMSAL